MSCNEMTCILNLHGKKYMVKNNEFQILNSEYFYPLTPIPELSDFDRELLFLKKLTFFSNNLVVAGFSHGGYIPFNSASFFDNVDMCFYNNSDLDRYIFSTNLLTCDVNMSNKICVSELNKKFPLSILYNTYQYNILVDETQFLIIIGGEIRNINYVQLSFYGKNVYIRKDTFNTFEKLFRIVNNNIVYDKLINLLIMVKNAGPDFENILLENKEYIDHWTILDTGSTDNTIEIIKKTLFDIPGKLYCEPFINFRDSRNRLLELASLENIRFNIMLDDTYVLKGKIREFLHLMRTDTIADSFSLYVQEEILGSETIDNVLTYSSNRITKPEKKLKYIYKIHEILEHNKNILIPKEYGYILDYVSPYMKERTKTRKNSDLILLFEEHKSDPTNPRHVYYIAETYLCLQDYINAYTWYEHRSKMTNGYDDEKFDSIYKMGVLMDLNLGNWEKAQQHYLSAYNYNPTRCESMFMLGSHYANIEEYDTAYLFLKRAYDIGRPTGNMNLKLYISDYHIPQYLVSVCHILKKYDIAELCAIKLQEWYQNKSDIHSYTIWKNWENIYKLLNGMKVMNARNITPKPIQSIPLGIKKRILFIIPGGWDYWDGNTLYEKGLGGSETFVIKVAEQLAENNEVVVCCNCKENTFIKKVTYIKLADICDLLASYTFSLCFVNRYPVYLFPCLEKIEKIEKTYLILHDLPMKTDIIHKDVYSVLCISNWHAKQFLELFPEFKTKTKVISYGIDISSFPVRSQLSQKQKYSFIYPSFPNRGLLPLLRMFPKITEKYPSAHLSVFCDTKHDFVQKHWKRDMDEIELLLEQQKNNVTNYGWCNYSRIREEWAKTQIWFYPCTFLETCCLTAYEAGASYTIAITNNLGALEESVGDRGIMIPGDVNTLEWQEKALNVICDVIEHYEKYIPIIEKNRNWIQEKDYSIVSKKLLEI